MKTMIYALCAAIAIGPCGQLVAQDSILKWDQLQKKVETNAKQIGEHTTAIGEHAEAIGNLKQRVENIEAKDCKNPDCKCETCTCNPCECGKDPLALPPDPQMQLIAEEIKTPQPEFDAEQIETPPGEQDLQSELSTMEQRVEKAEKQVAMLEQAKSLADRSRAAESRLLALEASISSPVVSTPVSSPLPSPVVSSGGSSGQSVSFAPQFAPQSYQAFSPPPAASPFPLSYQASRVASGGSNGGSVSMPQTSYPTSVSNSIDQALMASIQQQHPTATNVTIVDDRPLTSSNVTSQPSLTPRQNRVRSNAIRRTQTKVQREIFPNAAWNRQTQSTQSNRAVSCVDANGNPVPCNQ